MTEHMIEFDAVGKRYRLGQHLGQATDLREAVMARLMNGFGRRSSESPDNRAPSDDLWALRDVTLAVDEGDVLGVVGRNGAGKSTFLKVVGRVTTPTVGVARTRGRIGSLLEVGTGFNDELTGRENTYLSGAILGMSRLEVKRQLDEIVAFAGIEAFMDTPVKRYSSGMYLRLAFAVAAHLTADVLLVDEVLAVGDAEFRRQCLSKMAEVGSAGQTVVFASHHLDALTQLCTSAIWFDNGQIVAQGDTVDVVRQYLGSANPSSRFAELSDGDEHAPAQLRRVAVLDSDLRTDSTVLSGEEIVVELDIEVREAPPEIDVAVIIERVGGPLLLDENLARDFGGLSSTGRHRLRLALPPILTPGDYTVSIWMGTSYDDVAEHQHVLTFTIEGDDPDKAGRLLDLRAPWTVEIIDW